MFNCVWLYVDKVYHLKVCRNYITCLNEGIELKMFDKTMKLFDCKLEIKSSYTDKVHVLGNTYGWMSSNIETNWEISEKISDLNRLVTLYPKELFILFFLIRMLKTYYKAGLATP